MFRMLCDSEHYTSLLEILISSVIQKQIFILQKSGNLHN